MDFVTRIKNAAQAVRAADTVASQGGEWTLMESKALQKLITEVEGYRILSGGSLDDDSHKLRTQQQASYALWRKNLLAQRLIDVNVDFIVGDGVSLIARHEQDDVRDKVQEVLDKFWYDPVNAMDDDIDRIATELLLWGEVCIPALVNPADGSLRLGWISPLEVVGVTSDPQTGQPVRVEISKSAAEGVGTRTLEVIRYDDSQQKLVGEVFYTGIRKLSGNARGVPEIAAALEWVGVLDRTLRSHADRAEADSAWVWDVMLKGKNDAELKAWIQTYWTKPKPGAVRARNENMEINAISPNLAAADMDTHTKTVLAHILGGYGFPLHWFGSGADANLATASVMAEPTRKALRRKQKVFKRLVSYFAWFAVGQAVERGVLPAVFTPGDEPFDVQMPDLSGPDMASAGAAVQAVTSALAVAVDREMLSRETAIEIAAAVFNATGLEVDPAIEKERIEGDAQVNAEQEKQRELEAERRLQLRLAELKGAQDGNSGAHDSEGAVASDGDEG